MRTENWENFKHTIHIILELEYKKSRLKYRIYYRSKISFQKYKQTNSQMRFIVETGLLELKYIVYILHDNW